MQSRMIQDDLSRSQGYASLSPEAQHLALMLIPHFSSHGKMSGSSYFIKAEIVPLMEDWDIPKIEAVLAELSTSYSRYLIYEVDGLRYICDLEFKARNPGLRRLGKDKLPNPPVPSPGVSPGLGTGASPGDGTDEVPHEIEVEIEKEEEKKRRTSTGSVLLKLCDLEKSQEGDHRLVKLLADLMRKNNPKAKLPPNFAQWVNQCRLLRKKDNRTPEEIEKIIRFSQSDSFWHTNILSMKTLREKYDKLWLKAKAGKSGNGSNGSGIDRKNINSKDFRKGTPARVPVPPGKRGRG